MTLLSRYNAVFAHEGVCRTGGTDTLILGRMVCSTSQPWKGLWYSTFLRFWPVEDKEAGGLVYRVW